MWLIVRKKASINQVLRDFCPEYQIHSLRVRDIIKFGRVNFKITTLNCDRIDKIYNGSCYSKMKQSNIPYKQKDLSEAESSIDRDLALHTNLTEMNLQNDGTVS